jgi:hypothetical protein
MRSSSSFGEVWRWGVIGLGLAACTGEYAVIGLRPEYPPASHAPTTVDSLRPTLRWRTHIVPQATYDLRIWRGERNAPAELVYAHNALPAPWHTVEASLEPSTLYFWTVRARLDTEGRVRVTDWGVLKLEPPSLYDPALARVPHPGFYRFETPRGGTAP